MYILKISANVTSSINPEKLEEQLEEIELTDEKFINFNNDLRDLIQKKLLLNVHRYSSSKITGSSTDELFFVNLEDAKEIEKKYLENYKDMLGKVKVNSEIMECSDKDIFFVNSNNLSPLFVDIPSDDEEK
jgi:hypothetical protein